ncbi:type II secretion system secretin GspD [Hydrogenivirga sp. 128-5-R1-1]|uniref:type II secretion system secretin GspD n=1 Tax=Hydrogenivirga sp. 128-5-R1-1 TaxID=392423 RepID=UPI00015F386A|nr:type II secretion system secretin GspD [Hydrogenivirga sp. 128-5-R1-1]EDP76469.1 general secretion pathway protein D [Hydrogenivirga sp. 128-5-R1-1]
MGKVLVVLLIVLGFCFSQEGLDLESLAEEAKRKGEVVLNFQNTDIGELALFMGELVGKNVVVDPAVRGKVTLVFSKPLSLKEAWDVFTSALFMQGYGVVEGKKTVKVLPVNEAVTVAKFKRKPAEGELAVLVFNLRYADAQTVMNAVRPFLSPFARVSMHSPSNSLIIADVGENIDKARRILSSLDRSGIEGEVRVYRLRHLSVKDAVKLVTPLNSVFSKRFGIPLVVSSSDEANALVVFAPAEAHGVIEEIISEIDTREVVSEVRSFYIIPLKFISAEEIAESLQSLLGGGRGRVSRAVNRPVQRTQKKGGSPQRKPQGNVRTQVVKKIGFITTKEGMKIGFDRGTNSVILYATKSEYEGIRSLISGLDVRRKQVLIAATIVEASTKSLLDIGVRWQILGKRGGASFRGTSLSNIYSSFASGNFLMGVFSDVGRTVTVGDATFFFPDLVLLFSLLETGSGFNIISNPRVLTLDNQPAIIKVGQVVPYAEGVKFDINGQPIITYDYKEVGLELNVTPRISGDNLRLTIGLNLEEIIDFVTNEIGATSYTVPVTSNREVNSDVVIENGQTVILGGLVSTKTLKTMEGVPGLWRIPILGRLFRRDVKQKDKTTLFIFITPYVVSSPEELTKITEEHRKLSEKIKKMLEEKKKKEQEEEDEEDFYF